MKRMGLLFLVAGVVASITSWGKWAKLLDGTLAHAAALFTFPAVLVLVGIWLLIAGDKLRGPRRSDGQDDLPRENPAMNKTRNVIALAVATCILGFQLGRYTAPQDRMEIGRLTNEVVNLRRDVGKYRLMLEDCEKGQSTLRALNPEKAP